MSKAVYVGVNNVSRQSKKMYVGVGNVAKQVKKGYIGVNNIARQFFSSEKTLQYYGYLTNFSYRRIFGASVSYNDYALFGYGWTNESGLTNTGIDCYNSSLTHSLLTLDTNANLGAWSCATTVGSYAIFAFGNNSGSTPMNLGVVLNSSLTSSLINFSVSKYQVGAASFSSGTYSGYAMFGGGTDSSSISVSSVQVVSPTLTISSVIII